MKNRILFLLHLPPPIHGSSVVGSTIKGSSLINSKFNCQYINLLASKSIDDSGIINTKKILEFLVIWSKAFVAIIKKRPNLCYFALTTTGAAFFRDVFFVTLLKIFRIKRIYHLHNKGVNYYKDKNFYRVCYDYVFENAAVILLSKRLYPDIQAFVPESNIFICPNGIADEHLSPHLNVSLHKAPRHLAKEQNPNSKKPVQILFLSNLFEAKGVYILLEACNILKNKNLNFHCTFVGGEGDINEQQFQNKIQLLKLLTFVDYAGKKYGQEKKDAYLTSDIFAFPSLNECFGLVLVEAMQFQLPIVTSLEGGIPDIVEDGVTGFLVAPSNVDKMAEKLELLIRDPDLRQQMGEAGRKKYENEYSLEIFENKLNEIFEKVSSPL